MTNRELDRWLAEKTWDENRCRVCGWPIDPEGKFCKPCDCAQRPAPHRRADQPGEYSTDPVAMMALLDRMRELGWRFDLRSYQETTSAAFYRANTFSLPFSGRAETLPLAVARAAYRALGGTDL